MLSLIRCNSFRSRKHTHVGASLLDGAVHSHPRWYNVCRNKPRGLGRDLSLGWEVQVGTIEAFLGECAWMWRFHPGFSSKFRRACRTKIMLCCIARPSALPLFMSEMLDE